MSRLYGTLLRSVWYPTSINHYCTAEMLYVLVCSNRGSGVLCAEVKMVSMGVDGEAIVRAGVVYEPQQIGNWQSQESIVVSNPGSLSCC